MAKHKSPSVLNTRVTRIFLADYLLLKDLSNKAGISMAEALNKVLTRDWAATKSAQIPLPVTMAEAMPAPVFRATTLVTLPVKPQSTIATNGSKAAAFRIKPKGARHA
ncbi:unnamed protein product [marine sediment metagenome]|uniref:Uncharacterized protein n=1 Tax=marine sediment metagenome TaxID=412755 RepID=X1VU57_9ZZZZ